MSECLTPAQIKSLPTAALRLVQHDLRKTLVPDAVRRAQDLQRALVWVDREVGRRKVAAKINPDSEDDACTLAR